MQSRSQILTAAILCCLSANTMASDNVEINSFMTLGLATSSNDDGTYLNRINTHISLENDSHYGINIRTEVHDRLTGAAQLLATSDKNNFNVEAEWAYLSYKVTPDSSIRAGKLNLSTFLLSDYITVGSLYPWIRPPSEVYENNPMKNYLGVEWLHITRFGSFAKLTSQFFVGSAQVQENSATLFQAQDGYGVNFQLDTESVTLRIGAITPEVVIEFTDLTNPGAPPAVFDNQDRALMYTAGLSWDFSGFIGYSEYVKTEVDNQTQAFFPNQEGFYVTLGMQMGDFLPHVTYAKSDGEDYTGALPAALVATGAIPPNKQESVAFGIRYDIDDNIDFKVEYMVVEPEPGNFGLNTTAPSNGKDFNVISMAVDVIF